MSLEPQRAIFAKFTLWFDRQLEDTTPAGRARAVHRMRQFLRAERQRGLDGHWTYSRARHAALFHAYRVERKLLGSSTQNANGPR